MATVTINNKEVQVPDQATIIQACELADVEIPRFCYHERLSIAGNCRMCLVEVEGGPPKPVASCAMNVADGMKIKTDSPMVKKAREGVMEFLLANHPLDCPICDQGGECDLQDQAYQYGHEDSEYSENKRAVKKKNLGPLIKTEMTRCIHCTRCVRFTTDVAGSSELGAIGRGETMEITSYLEKSMTSELSGNVIDLCPVGALTSKPYAFKARPWELKKTETIDIMDAVVSNIRMDVRGLEVMRILPRLNEEINEEWISDKTRFCYDGLKYQRLDSAYIKKNGKLQKTSTQNAISEIVKKINQLNGEEIGALSGSLSSANEIYALKTLLDKLKSPNYDCRLSGEKLTSSDRASYLFNTSIAKIEESDLCLLIGVNPKKDAPILNSKITKKSLNSNYKIGAIGLDQELTYKYQNLGSSVEDLKSIINDQSEFSQALQQAKKPILILGSDALKLDSGAQILNLTKKIAEKYNFIQENFNGFNFLSKSTGLINGLELGFDKSSTANIVEKCQDSQIKLLFLLGVDDDIEFEKLGKSYKIYIGSHGDKGAKNADIILPGQAFSEKEAIYINLEGRPQKTTRAVFGPENSKPDDELIIQIAKKAKIDLGFENSQEIQQEIAKNYQFLSQPDQIVQANWQKSTESEDDISNSQKINSSDYDFYQTNQIARSSRILARCSNEIKS